MNSPAIDGITFKLEPFFMAGKDFTQWAALVAYLAAVAVGCLVVGLLIGGQAAMSGRQPWSNIPIYAVVATTIGFFPGLLLSLPGVLFSSWIRRRFGGFTPGRFWLLGILNGSIICLTVGFAVGAYNGWVVAAFGLAGGCSGGVFFKVERLLQRRGWS
jgi:hypothetical protein